jgi:hypothetical protein
MWKTITTHPNYEVSSAGEVRNTVTGRTLKLCIHNAGYHKVKLCPDRTTYLIHRLVAMYHLENPENNPIVDHIDRDRTNNSVENLRWVTQSENLLNKDYLHKEPDETHYIIAIPSGSFRVRLRGRTKVDKCFNSLEEAIIFRDRFIAENPR